ncbi:MAG: S8 family serine peptidase [Saprospiraceae bacterium]
MSKSKVILLLIFLIYCSFLFSQPSNNLYKLSEGLKKEWLKKEKTEVIIQFHDQKIDLSSYRSYWDKSQKGSFIFKALQENARISQYDVQKWLTAKGISFKSNVLVNALLVSLDKSQVYEVINRKEVAFIYDNPEIFVSPNQRSTENQSLRSASEWGIEKIKAPAVWAMGITGKGIVIAGQDTGYDWTHPDLVSAYRGNLKETVKHDYHWFDAIDKASPLNKDTLNPCGYSIKIPCDDDVHGTHTMGTMVGKNLSGTSIGVAPGASWIGARNMDRGSGNPFSYLACFDWFLAPRDLAGKNPNPLLAPHVINNSWSCPTSEGCFNNHIELFEKAITLLRKAGIMVVVSAGNDGGSCETMNEIPVTVSGAFSIGATRSNDSIASFSSRGPALIQGKKVIKPDVSAPGVSVKSALPGNRYGLLSGTSMAGPHVAGLAALLFSANASLIGQVDKVEQIIRETSLPLYSSQVCSNISGGSYPNPVYGYGRVDALAAVKKALSVTSINESVDPAIQIYPLAGHQQLYISTEFGKEIFTLTLFDIYGREVMNNQVDQSISSINLPSLPNGMYIYTFSNKEKMTKGILWINQNR